MPISSGRTVHRASTESSIGLSLCDESEIIITRLVDDTGWIICGALPTFGNACGCDSRSDTSWRAREDVGAALEEHRDRRQARHRVRADRLDALDAVEQVLLERNGDQLLDLGGRQAERLGLDLDVGLRVLGRTSTGALRSWAMPTTRRPAARATTSARNRIMLAIQPVIASSLARGVRAHDSTTPFRNPPSGRLRPASTRRRTRSHPTDPPMAVTRDGTQCERAYSCEVRVSAHSDSSSPHVRKRSGRLELS